MLKELIWEFSQALLNHTHLQCSTTSGCAEIWINEALQYLTNGAVVHLFFPSIFSPDCAGPGKAGLDCTSFSSCTRDFIQDTLHKPCLYKQYYRLEVLSFNVVGSQRCHKRKQRVVSICTADNDSLPKLTQTR